MSILHEILDMTSELIRIPSTHSRPAEITRCAQHIMQWCQTYGLHATCVTHEGIPSLLILPDTQARLVLMSHLDVVDAPDELFLPRLEGDHLWGRGAVDDKYAIALSLVLFRERVHALRQNGQSQADMALGVLITGDEEIGGNNGAAKTLPLVQADYVLALDGGSPEKLVVQEKGVLNLCLTATGRTAHGARPWLGQNAIDILFNDYAKLRQLFPDSEDTEHWHRTINFGKIQAGKALNQVPGTAQGWFNIRFTEQDDPQELLQAISASVSSQVELVSSLPLFHALPSPITQRLLDYSPGTNTGREHGASDAQFLMALHMPGAIWGAQGYGSAHSPQERVSVSSIEHIYTSLHNLVVELEQAGTDCKEKD